jgi:hypothetical protein
MPFVSSARILVRFAGGQSIEEAGSSVEGSIMSLYSIGLGVDTWETGWVISQPFTRDVKIKKLLSLRPVER